MLRATFLGGALILPALFSSATAEQLHFGFENLVPNNVQIPLNLSNYQLACDSISRNISPASQVFYPGAVLAFLSSSDYCLTSELLDSPQFAEDIAHWVNSSSQISACSVRPGTVDDLSSIVRYMTL